MDALPAAVRVKGRVASRFGLGGGHALEVKCVNGVRDVLAHNGEHLLLALKGTYTLKSLGNNANVEMIA